MRAAFRIFALTLSLLLLAKVESMDNMVTCTVEEATRDKSHCDLQLTEAGIATVLALAAAADSAVSNVFTSNPNSITTGNVWDEVSEILRECTELGMNKYVDPSGWEMHTPRKDEGRSLQAQQQQERELITCEGSCYGPRSSCCLLDPSFCASTCGAGCECRRRQLEANAAHPSAMERKHIITKCVANMEELRERLLDQDIPNFCLGDNTAAAIICNTFSSNYI
jgi:hypothetical protein